MPYKMPSIFNYIKRLYSKRYYCNTSKIIIKALDTRIRNYNYKCILINNCIVYITKEFIYKKYLLYLDKFFIYLYLK